MRDDEQGLRDRLVRVGVDLLAQDGGEALSLREIARRAGVSHGAPRRYFPTHRDLLAAIAKEGYQVLAGQVAEAVATSGPDPYAGVLAIGRGYLRFAEARPEMFALMFRHDLLRGNAEGLCQASRPLFDTLVRLIAEARPELTSPDTVAPEVVAAALWANLHGIAELRRWGSLQMITQTDHAESVLRAAVEAHLARAAPRPAG